MGTILLLQNTQFIWRSARGFAPYRLRNHQLEKKGWIAMPVA